LSGSVLCVVAQHLKCSSGQEPVSIENSRS